MAWWRGSISLILLATVVLPAAMPFLELMQRAEGWQAWMESERLLSLWRNTLGLAAGTLLLALPAGVAAAIVLYRTDLPWRRGLRFLTLLTLFIPLPLFTSAWQAALGTGGWFPVAVWSTAGPGDPDISATGIGWKPWAHGLGAAIWVHAMAGFPWVIMLVGQ